MKVNMQNPKVTDAEMMTCGKARLGTVTLSEDFPGDRGHSSMTIILTVRTICGLWPTSWRR